MNHPARRTATTARWIGVRALLAGSFALCAAAGVHATPEKAARYYDDAMRRFEQNDLAGAVLQLKNTLQEDQKMLAAHLLLGRTLMRRGELKAAEAAFEEALRQGVNRSEVVLLLGQLYLQLDEGGKLLDQIPAAGLPPAVQAEALTLRGSAQALAGNLAAASQSFAQARALSPGLAAPYLAEAPLFLRAGERERARASATRATELAPQSDAAWYVQGTILHSLDDGKAALVALDKALALNPRHVDARIARAGLLISLGREAEAGQELAQLKAWDVVEPRAAYLRALLATRRGDAASARAEYGEAAALIDALPSGQRAGNEPLLMSGALAHRALGNLEKAREYLETLLARNGRHIPAQMLLASILLEGKDYARAQNVLDALRRVRPDDPELLYLLGSAHLARKQYVQAAEYFERLVAGGTGPRAALRELGVSQLALGRDQDGIASLEKAFARDQKDLRAGVELATLYARQGQATRALQITEIIVKNDPGNLAMLNFLGNVKGRLGDKAGARAAFERVLAKERDFRPAGINLSWLDIEEGRFEPARARLQAMLTKRADDPDVLFQLGVLELRARHPQEALARWQRAEELQRVDARPGLAIIELLASQRQSEPMLAAARTLAAKYPDSVPVQLALARGHLQVGDPVKAKAILSEATRLAGFDPVLQTQIARLQVACGNLEGASYSTAKALQSRPDHLDALVLNVELAARRGSAPGVDAALKSLTTRHPAAAATLIATAGVALSRGQTAVALSGLRTAMDKEPNTGTAVMLAHAHISAQEPEKALALLEGWSAKHPEDTVALNALAQVQIYTRHADAARKTFDRILAADPQDAATLANYAQLLLSLGDPAAADAAERAVRLAPGNPEYLDTLGWILAQQGKAESGVVRLRDARLRDPGNAQVRFHLAWALAKLGRKAEAKEELRASLVSTPPSTAPEFVRLKAELGL